MRNNSTVMIIIIGLVILMTMAYLSKPTREVITINPNYDSIAKPYLDSIAKLDSIIVGYNDTVDSITEVRIINRVYYDTIRKKIPYYTDDYLDSIIFMEPGQYKMLRQDGTRVDSFSQY